MDGSGDPRYREFLDEQWRLHQEKSAGYGTPEDPFRNLRATEWLGFPAWKFCLVRASDKWARIQNHVKGMEDGKPIPGDALENDMRDMANYLGYAKILYEEWAQISLKEKAVKVLGRPDV